MARGIIVSFAGYPFTPSSLMPDNGLAGLAGSPVAAGHGVKLLDYGTVDMIPRFVPEATHKRLAGIWATASKGKVSSPITLLSLYLAARSQAKALNRALAEVADDISREIEGTGASFVGFKLWNGDGFSSSVKLAGLMRKRHPKVKVIGGGPQVDWFEECIFDYTDVFHCLSRGEGEETIVELAEWAEGRKELEAIPNVLYKTAAGALVKTPAKHVANLDTLALPCYDTVHYPTIEGNRHLKMITIDESRARLQ